MQRWKEIERYLIAFLQDEVGKTGLTNAVAGVSGGIDSAVVAVLCHKAFGDNFLSVLLPSQFSSASSEQDALELCEKFGIAHEIVSIAPMVEGYCQEEHGNLRIGNFSARMRMAVLFDISAREKALVVGTSNKSELMLGYGTLYGDLASALNPIGDLYKTEIFEFAAYLGVPDSILNKPPSADLYAGQSDEADLGYSYAQIDSVLRLYVEERLSKEELLARGHEAGIIDLISERIYRNHFKRLPPLIAKLTSRTVNCDFLYPRDILLQGKSA